MNKHNPIPKDLNNLSIPGIPAVPDPETRPLPEIPVGSAAGVDSAAIDSPESPVSLPSPETLPPEAAAAAEKMGISNRELVKRLLRIGMMNQQRQKAKRRTQQEYLSRLQFNSILAQAKELQKLYPDFDLAEELKNPVFARLLAPGIGLDLQTVYETIHHQALKRAAMIESGLMLTKAIQSGRTHPIENGLDSRYFTAPLRTDPAALTPEERKDIRNRVMKGERVTF